MSSEHSLVVGAAGGLGMAVMQRLQQKQRTLGNDVYAVSRRTSPLTPTNDRLIWQQCDYSEWQIRRICSQLKEDRVTFSEVVICNGVLHGDSYWPEKKLEELAPDALLEVFRSNALVPILWLKHLLPLLSRACSCKVAVFSARVGSIEDNRLGGWYSYRASKAALNMLLRSAAVEYARRAKHVKLLAFHPGTTDTPLSKPFQQRVPADKLFSPDFVAERLLTIMDELPVDGELAYLDWAGKPIPW